jgi:hypothetical protein
MRRNDENLLVLAGADSSSPRRENALLADVLRAAQSEVELYNRIEFGVVDLDVSVISHAVNDVVRLVAELFDNATRFSPPDSTVVADGRRIGDYVLIQIEDRGLGMTPEQLHSVNERLAEPPTVDVASFRMMGLAVVSRLASRYRIKVELRPNSEGGTITNVTLPTAILVLPRLRGREPVIPRARSPLAVEQAMGRAGAGWPMPQLPGLAAGSSAPAVVITVDRPAYEAPPSQPNADPLGYPTGTRPRTAPPDITDTPPIYRSMEAVWFGGDGPRPPLHQPMAGQQPVTNHWAPSAATAAGPPPGGPTAPPAGPPPPPPAPPLAPAAARPYVSAGNPPSVPTAATPPPVPPNPPTGAAPPPRREPDSWSSSADDGWRAAQAAAQPPTAGTTRSGLPKRVPAAQLVPGAVDPRTTAARAKRTPDDVRGLLSAYHRGVQRGRSGGEGSSLGPRPDTEETH